MINNILIKNFLYIPRDQFSQLMMVYLALAADIVEIFEAFRESQVMLEPLLTYAILGVWSWSLLQFGLVLGASSSGRKARCVFTLNPFL